MTRRARPAIGARLTGLVEGVEALGQPAATTLPVQSLQPGTFQPRAHFAPEGLEELARSIREQGILQPLLVRPLEKGRYEIVAGERRWRAAQLAGLTEVPVLLRDLTNAQAQLAAAVENLQREDLNVVEEVRARLQVAASTLGVPAGEAVARLFALDRHPEEDPEAVARLDAMFGALGRETWRSFVKNRAAVLNLPEDVQAAVRSGLDYRKALIIGRVSDEGERARLLQAAAEGATVQMLREQVTPPRPVSSDPLQAVARRLTDRRTLAGLDAARRRKVERLLQQIGDLLGPA
ncbi:ParB/RepB/Spo0J family partition protein (plasmid) [Deinococcus metallilatus]|uniref:ParB family chromosome partitioning protein n=1 Tax=Deinococcus metallilatus TaxID=1211322 RepID=A0AAJ5F9M6_9DEIO|nr:ParB/RepB/Spo0J family partition protein [Deinococcus metallilatus]MBB5293291.1 ParB family chromosome partitioning protein [Deinococcus metallilatus]QBY06402.1 ParB/RepB/Spo0J family partition protein [Deinococcus metallilatus]RXJ18081.1 ParB/RepB/Spo0J family partition protein [Deinococcus metallilatus]TLK32017.1 ParB/RepB/Spo0J family partition protein [Deinococcus metallilatus]GMA15486.1 putative chromosome 2-partitioning protein ParB [Deinococcus metallilatus]